MLEVDDDLRLKELVKYKVSFDEPEVCYNELAEIARSSLSTPLSGISIVDKDNVWLKARLGIEANCLDREGAFCSHAIESERDIYCVNDTLQHHFYKTHPLVINFGIRFYAAAVLRNNTGYPIGTIWVMDIEPRELSKRDETILLSLSSQVIRLLDFNYTTTITGLPNRKAFINTLQKIIGTNKEPSLKVENRQLARGVVGVLVIENLDIVSSIFGQEGVNKALAVISDRMKLEYPKGTILAHIEDNTFAFANISNSGNEATCYESISDKLAEPIPIDGHPTQVQISFGFTIFPDNGNTPSSLLFQALTAARRSKASNVVVFPEKFNIISDSSYIKELHRVIKLGVNQSELIPYYQPQVNSQSVQLSGLESLARWDSGSLGTVSPTTFIQLAEESGLITTLDFVILEKVCVDIQKWQSEKLPLLPVSVNLSRESVALKDAPIRISEILAKYEVAYASVKIEITESTMISDYDPVLSNIKQLRAMGLSVSIDDFGTGFSNLSTLRLLKFDQLKVDRQFIHNISHNHSISGLFDFIKNVGSLFSANLMCEGMEEKEDIEYLISVGCYYHQGWYYSKALDFNKMSLLMKELESAKESNTYPKNHVEMSNLFKKFQSL